jgi:hypothetical protein
LSTCGTEKRWLGLAGSRMALFVVTFFGTLGLLVVLRVGMSR